jgi:DNA-binding response OmpR family regulator
MDPQERTRRSDISIVFGEPQGGARAAMRQALAHEGFTKLRDVADLETLRAVLDAAYPDVLVVDAAILGPDPGTTLRDLRHGQLGRNPYVPIIVTAWDPSQATVRSIIDGGADTLIAKPLAPSTLLDRLHSLANHRKPFVVTADYIGPDRRRDPQRDGGMAIPTIEVPNALAAKMRGEALTLADLERAIRTTASEVNAERLHRNGFQVGFLVTQVLPALQAETPTPETRALLEKLRVVSHDTMARLVGTPYEHIGDLCSALTSVVDTLLHSMTSPPPKSLALLKKLGDALLLAFHPNSDAALLTEQIATAVKRYQVRKGAPAGPAS